MVGLAVGKAGGGDLDDKTGATSGPLFIQQAAFVHIEKAGGEEESEAEAFPAGTLGNEGLEDVCADALRDAGAVVFYAEDHLGSGGVVGFEADPDGGVLTAFERV